MKKPKIFIACDTNKVNEVKRIINQTKTNKLDIGYKFGLEFFYTKDGRKFISKIKKEKIFLDLKLNDIPATCSAAVKSLKDLKNINYLTLHANAGEETIKAVVKTAKKINSRIKILLVTILTSISNSSIKKIGYTKSIKDIVKKQALLANTCGCHGIVCAGTDLKFVKKIFKGEIVTPGIRLQKDTLEIKKELWGLKKLLKMEARLLLWEGLLLRAILKIIFLD